MRSRRQGPEINLDPEIEKTLRNIRRTTSSSRASSSMDEATRNQMREELEAEFNDQILREKARAVEDARQQWVVEEEARKAELDQAERTRSCLEAITPQFNDRRGVVYGDIARNQTFKIDGSVLQSLKETQFHGLKDECPIDHLRNFSEIADSYQVANIEPDQMRLRLFLHTLAGKAKDWWWRIPEGSVQTWGDLHRAFMAKYYSSARSQMFIRQITTFNQDDDESLAAAYERFMELIRKCPHHGQSEGALVRYFTQGLMYQIHNQLDTMAGGNFLDQAPDDCWNMIEKVVNNSTRAHQRSGARPAGALALTEKTHTEARAASELFSDRFARMEKAIERMSEKKNAVNSVGSSECSLCGGHHRYEECPETRQEAAVNYMQSQFGNRNVNHPNLSYKNQQNWPPAQPQNQNTQSQQPFQSSNYQGQSSNQNREPSLKELVAQMAQSQITANAQLNQQLGQLATQQGKTNESVASDLKELKSQMSKMMETLNERKEGSFPSNTTNPRHGQLNAVTTRSGKVLDTKDSAAADDLASARKEASERSPEPEQNQNSQIPETAP